jgi:hypothetical protein
MSQTPPHLVDHVIPHVPVRQWFLSLRIPLREHGVLARNARLRALVVPQEPAETEQTTEPTATAECENDPARVRLLKRVLATT